ncbi:hypothetical protein HRbin30_02546 [bacterium HR30]|nr:hypothetical protein HRbin30_02546 [bacterium HR30]
MRQQVHPRGSCGRLQTTGLLAVLAWAVALGFFVSPVHAMVTIRVTTSDAFTGDEGAPAAPATMTVRLERESPSEVATTVNFDLIFQTSQFDLAGVCDDGSACQLSETCPGQGTCRLAPVRCQKDERLADHILEVVPPDFQNVPSGEYRVRFALVTTTFVNPLPVISDGTLLTCTLPLQSTASPGPQVIRSERLQVADNQIPAREVPSQLVLELGRIVAGARPTETATPSVTPTPSSTATAPTPTPTGTLPTPTFTHTVTPGTPIPRTPCPSPRPAPAGPAVYVEDVVLAASGPVTLTVRLAAGGREIVATQNDLVLGGGIRIEAGNGGRPDCTVNPALDKNGSSFGFLPPGCSGETCTQVRAVIVSLENVDPIPDGAVLYTCRATLTDVEARVEVTGVVGSDANGDPVPGVGGRDGFVCVEPPPTATPTITHTPGPRSPTPTSTAVGTASPTASPTPTVGTPLTATATPTRTVGVRSPTAPAAAEGNGCDCNVAGSQGGWSSLWLLLPAAYLQWRRRVLRSAEFRRGVSRN